MPAQEVNTCKSSRLARRGQALYNIPATMCVIVGNGV